MDSEFEDLPKCPFCNGDNFEATVWKIDGADLHMIECIDCFGCAPLDIWQARAMFNINCPRCDWEFKINSRGDMHDVFEG